MKRITEIDGFTIEEAVAAAQKVADMDNAMAVEATFDKFGEPVDVTMISSGNSAWTTRWSREPVRFRACMTGVEWSFENNVFIPEYFARMIKDKAQMR